MICLLIQGTSGGTVTAPRRGEVRAYLPSVAG